MTLLVAAVGTLQKEDLQVPCQIIYKTRLFRTRQLSAGLVGTALMTGLPQVSASVIETARARRIPVIQVNDEALTSRAERAERVRAAAASFAARLASPVSQDSYQQP